MNPENNMIIKEFEKLLNQIQYYLDNEKNKDDRKVNLYRYQSIQRVLEVLRKFKDKITSSKQLAGISGIGKGTLKRIDEILESGKLDEVIGDLDIEYLKYVEELDEIYGIGKRKAYALYKQYGVKSIKDLKNLYEAGKISLSDTVVKGLKYYDLVNYEIPREEMQEIDIYLHSVLARIDPELLGVMCGSYRRLAPMSGDIDFLIVHPEVHMKSKEHPSTNIKMYINYLGLYIAILKSESFIVETLTNEEGSEMFMGFCRYKDNPVRRIDIKFFPYESYYTALLYFTGPKNFTVRMRKKARLMGYLLNDLGLYNKEGTILVVNSEKDVFEYLGMTYISPDERD